MITKTELELLADEFFGIFRRGELERVSSTPIGSLSLEEAYRVQDLVIERRMVDGGTVAGYKVGCTSEAIRLQFGLSEPISAG
jgi:2-keto-4-pentenoate hydratase